MTPERKYEDQILDYLYGELSDTERAAFERRMGEDAALRSEVESLGRVRTAYRELPPVEPAPDALQRMTALLMQQAAQAHAGATGGAGGTDAAGSSEAVSEGGKILPLSNRVRGLRRVMLHPASGVFAAAAIALCWVVFKEKRQPAVSVAVSDTPLGEPTKAATIGAEPSSPAPLVPPLSAPARPAPDPREPVQEKTVVVGNSPVQLAQKEEAAKKVEVAKADLPGSKAGDKLDWQQPGKPTEVAPALPPIPQAPPAEKPRYGASSSRSLDGDGSGAGLAAAAGKKMAPRKLDSLNFDGLEGGRYEAKPTPGPQQQLLAVAKDAKGASPKPAPEPVMTKQEAARAELPPPPPATPAPVERERSFAQAPPPKTPARPLDRASSGADVNADSDRSVRGAIAQTQARRNERVVEELADQELAGMPVPQAGGAPSGNSTNSTSSSERYALRTQGQSQAPVGAGESWRAGASNGVPAAGPRGNDEYVQNAPQASAPAQMPSDSRRLNVNNIADDNPMTATQVAQLVELVKSGRCAEATALLQKIEQSASTARGLGEARALWQRGCVPTLNNQFDRNSGERQMLEAPAALQPAPAPSASAQYRSMPKPMMKRAAKAPAAEKASKAKAADSVAY